MGHRWLLEQARAATDGSVQALGHDRIGGVVERVEAWWCGG
jgi:hypothetical protein